MHTYFLLSLLRANDKSDTNAASLPPEAKMFEIDPDIDIYSKATAHKILTLCTCIIIIK
jgi:hypothetical protein